MTAPNARGELRLRTVGNVGLLSLAPRDPSGLTERDLDAVAWGPAVNRVPNPRIPPEGADIEVFHKNGVRVSAQWTHTSRRLRTRVLEWAPPQNPWPRHGTMLMAAMRPSRILARSPMPMAGRVLSA